MAIWDFRPKGDLLTTVAVGVGVAAAPVVIPLAWYAVRPLLKSILKGGFLLYETGRGACAEAAGGATETAAVKPETAERRTTATRQQERALAQNIGAIELQLTGKPAHEKAAKAKPKRQAKTSGKKTDKGK
jgi:hypothetical protein